ncbi:PDZ domain-containing protein [Sphingobacteriales bacterium UPWRP_1]|nr:hypothetical protein B6N25_06180 [Sphingobacteriales bacterium TSM_CSS]PSJ78660.1 PDZ domain-containing protein [Sphingobacteriales bacterium UPWRP_1]
MKNHISIAFLLLLIVSWLPWTGATAQNNTYRFSLDVGSVNNDQITVTLLTPPVNGSTAVYRMPKIIPGTYAVSDFGRFIEDLKAFDTKGKPLKVKQIDPNGWQIAKANKLGKITYKVNDTFDADQGDVPVYPMAGTNIQDQKNIVVNTHGFFGYFEGMENLPYRVEITKPAEFYGSSGLIPESTSPQKDVFATANYGLLVDAPIMYNRPDTTTINIAGTQVLVSVYSPNGMVTSGYVAKSLSNMLHAIKDYLGGDHLPVKKYAFLFYFVPPAESSRMQGALEHSYSSFYYLPEYPQEVLIPFIVDVAAHEFFHIVTPLNLHSEQIHYFNFSKPEMSEHLWLYEGSTEYAASHVQVQYGLITPDEYLNKVRDKIVNATQYYNDTLPFTVMSRGSADVYASQYQNVYEKGALISLCLDLKLIALSGGKYSLRKLIADLSGKYGKDKPFKDEELINDITALTNPEIGKFFAAYISGNQPLPYSDIFNLAGIDYIAEETYSDFSIGGNASIGFNPQTYHLTIQEIDETNTFSRQMGYQPGDELLKINGKEIDLSDMENFFKNATASLKDGDTMRVVVLRNGEELELKAPASRMDKKRYHQLRFNSAPSQKQLAVRKVWLQAPQLATYDIAIEKVATIDSIVSNLYQSVSGVLEGKDWNSLRALCKPDARLISVAANTSGQHNYRNYSLNEFIESAQQSALVSFFEKETGRTLEQFGNIAQVMSAYESREQVNGPVVSSGINSIQLVYENNRWWVVNILWDSASPDNPIPAKYKKK